MRHFGKMCLRQVATGTVCVFLTAAPAQATFQGANGKISFGTGDGIHTLNPDGSGETVLPPASAPRGGAKWSPDGQRFASSLECADGSCASRLATWAADGTDEQVIPGVEGGTPTWSSGGDQLAYINLFGTELRATNVDGTNDRLLETPSCPPITTPDWSPDSRRIAYERRPCDGDYYELGVFCFESEPQCGPSWPRDVISPNSRASFSPDGTRVALSRYSGGQAEIFSLQYPDGPEQRLTSHLATDRSPVWSPDGTKIAFVSNRDDPSPDSCLPGSCANAVYLMDPDGSNLTRISSIKDFQIESLDWQPIPSAVSAPYIRPRSASPVRFSLVQSLKECTSPDRVHGPPLAFGSCSQLGAPSHLWIGGGPFGGAPRSTGSMRVRAQVGAPGPPDDSDVKLDFSVTNVMVGSDLSDYPGELRVLLGLQLTAREPGALGQTTETIPLGFTAQCLPTADTTVGSDCAVDTTVNTFWPGAVRDGRRAIWALDQAQVLDGGSDGDVDTQTPSDRNDRFLTPGLWIP